MKRLTTRNRMHSSTSRQGGIALVVALVLLIAVTLVGLAAIRGTSLQERMAGNTYDREMSFQAAEAALNVGANDLVSNLASYSFNTAGTDCVNNNCEPNPVTDPNVTAGDWTKVQTSKTGTGPAVFKTPYTAAKDQPAYVVQRMGACGSGSGAGFVFTNDQNNPSYSVQSSGQCYRITARSGSNQDRSQVVLQATYEM